MSESGVTSNGGTGSVSVVIPTYNMDWCIARAVESCVAQSLPVQEIIVIDDGSTDNTEAVIAGLMYRHPGVKYFKYDESHGHLTALKAGIQRTSTDWIVLLDADDELTPKSVESRVLAAREYHNAKGVIPQLIYGDLCDATFTKLEGQQFAFLSRELCLCQTSTIMLGRNCLDHFPTTDNPYNTDDEIVLAIGRHFHVLHSGAVVAAYHVHEGPTRMSNDSRKVFQGVRKLVYDHRRDIIREHGIGRLALWYLRILKAFCNHRIVEINRSLDGDSPHCSNVHARLLLKLDRGMTDRAGKFLTRYLRSRFELDYF